MGTVYHLVAALERGDAARAWEHASSMPRGSVSLDHALALVALSSLHETPIERYEAAVDRWLERAQLERPDVPIDRLRKLLDLLPDLPAVTELQLHCEQYVWPVTLATLDHLLPRV